MGHNEDYIEGLIRQAHALYGETSIYEVIDADRDSVYYGQPDMDRMERYFAILDQVREWQEGK